jgi:hypothetical protein
MYQACQFLYDYQTPVWELIHNVKSKFPLFCNITLQITGDKKQSDEEQGTPHFAVRVNLPC